MKRKLLTVLLTLIATLCLCLAFAACDNGGNTGSDSNTEQGNTQKPDDGGEKPEHVHRFTDYVYNNDATCTEDGTETASCSCGETDTRTKEGTALGHDMQPVAAQEPTCTESGWDAYQECSRCHEKENYVEKEALEHKFTVDNVCSVCNEAWKFTYGLIYELDPATDTYTVLRGINFEDIVIPYGYQGKWVTKIGNKAFERCNLLTSIVVPASVTEIKDEAFYKCSKLSSVKLPDNMTFIEGETFRDCSSLKSISIPKNVTSIKDGTINSVRDFCFPLVWRHNRSYAAKLFSSGMSITPTQL